ncbi:MAG TPA: DNA topoisomerase [Xanthomonadales bacterium]|nr:DNA topoisomerase [Xanthomonadales bacterium]
MQINRLWITEKPEMARSLAAGLSLTFSTKAVNLRSVREDGCIALDNGDAVAYLFGHMLELAPPSAYLSEEQERGNAFKYLPLNPAQMIKIPKADSMPAGKETKGKQRSGAPREAAPANSAPSPQFVKVVNLIRSAAEIVNAGDIDREGQLIVDELLIHSGVDPRGATKPVWRLALTNPDEKEIRKLILKGLERNGDEHWVRRYEAAACRERGDWCIGMTGSRAYREITGYAKMSVGRVTTPTLAMVVNRELQIERFQPSNYFVPVITLSNGVRMRWLRRQGCEGTPGFDADGRIVSEAVARQIVHAITNGMRGQTTLAEAKRKFEAPPLPFSLGTLQSTASRRYGLTLKEVTQAAQALYERHKMITYVGTDCRYLPQSALAGAAATVQALSRVLPGPVRGANLALVSRAWNDAKTDEHSAIVPTGTVADNLNQAEKSVFEAVSRRFLAQFYPAHEYMHMRLRGIFGDDEFEARDREVMVRGWHDAEYDPDRPVDASESMDDADNEADNEGVGVNAPSLQEQKR